ncbi:MAG TPA: protein kinase, partial [Thermoanaerobaculia bacterium]|nr:protein kinase [Thermoanaerobaculia bacterium]
LTRGGAKLVDFGLAKWMGEQPKVLEGIEDHKTTTRKPLTAAGTVLGTVPYMAPEQLEGKPLDARTDIFAFGAILYEMATGVRAFQAESNASLIAFIMSQHPEPPSRVRGLLPPRLDRIVQTCLAKDPDERFQSTHDVKLALQWLRDPEEARAMTRERPKWPVAATAAVAALLAFLTAALIFRPRSARETVRFAVAPPAGSEFPSLGEGGGFALSPDGRRLVFAATTPDGRSFLWLRDFAAGEAQQLKSTEGAEYPFWSPQGDAIAFFAAGKLKRMSLPDGPPQTICDATSGRGGAWSRDGVILFAPNSKGGLFRIAAAGGTPQPVTVPDAQTYSHRWPVFLPDQNHFLMFAQALDASKSGIWSASLDAPRALKAVIATTGSVALAGDDLLYIRDGVLVRQRFDAKDQQLSGETSTVADGMVFYLDRGWAPLAAAGPEVIAFRRHATVPMRLGWYDRLGRRTAIIGTPGEMEGVALSPDGSRIAFGHFDPDEGLNHIWIAAATEGVPRRFSFTRGNQYSPVWAPDGARLFFSDDHTGIERLTQKPASGAGEEETIPGSQPHVSQYALSSAPDGRQLLYRSDEPATGLDMRALPLAGGVQERVVIAGPNDEAQGQFSPDGRFIAYASDESGRPEIYVQPFPPTGAKWQVSGSGGEQPRWRRDGRELFFVGPDKKLMAAGVTLGAGAFDASPPKPLFDTTLSVGYLGISQSYDVDRDGQRFVIASTDPAVPPAPIEVIIR